MSAPLLFPSLQPGHTPPAVTFPGQAQSRPHAPIEANPSVISDGYQTIPIQGIAIEPGIDAFIDDPVAFELEDNDKPFTVDANLPHIPELNYDPEDPPLAAPVRKKSSKTRPSQGGTPPEPARKKSSMRQSQNHTDSENRKSSLKQSAKVNEHASPTATCKKCGSCGSFAFGALLGFIPLFIVVRICVHHCRKGPWNYDWDDRWLTYGETFGLFLLVICAIVIVLININ